MITALPSGMARMRVSNAERLFTESKYGLNVSHYVSLPSFSYDVFWKYSQAEISLISDPELSSIISQNIRGGFCGVVKPLLEQKEGENQLYLDINSLYSSAMCGKLPISDFESLSNEEMKAFTERERWLV